MYLRRHVNDFNNPQLPLNLPSEDITFEIQAPGYSTLDFNVDVLTGQITVRRTSAAQ